MEQKVGSYPMVINESFLDVFGHMNHAMYLTLFEQARWDFVSKNGYGLKKIRESGIGPIVLEIKLNFLKELHEREEIVIESHIVSFEGKILKSMQKMVRKGEICCTAEMTFALFDLKQRKIIAPPEDWQQTFGVNS